MAKFANKEEYKHWIETEEWYQTIILPSGLSTQGKVRTDERLTLFNHIDFKDKSVLDIGCNSGQYSLLAKSRGAREVLGIDIDKKRIAQAQTLAENEGLNIKFEERNVFEAGSLGKFDIVFCIAVLTEIQDFFGSLEKVKSLIGEKAFIELDLAKPVAYLSRSRSWLRGESRVAEVRRLRGGRWTVNPTFRFLKDFFGKDFTLKKLEGGVRYDLVEITREV